MEDNLAAFAGKLKLKGFLHIPHLESVSYLPVQELSRFLDQFHHLRTCVLARKLCLLISDNWAVFNKDDVQACCEFVSKLCKEAGCDEASNLCSKAVASMLDSEEEYLMLCEKSCKICSESRVPLQHKLEPEKTIYVA